VVGIKSAGSVAYCEGGGSERFYGVLANECNHGGGVRFMTFFALFLCGQPTGELTQNHTLVVLPDGGLQIQH
jgi:hypothetical protein